MPLVRCPDCGRQISDSASTCISCGRPMTAQQSVAAVAAVLVGQASSSPPAEIPDLPATWRCSRCGAQAFQKYSLVYEANRSNSESSTGGVLMGGESFAFASGSTRGTHVTELGRRVAPPDEPSELSQGHWAVIAFLALAAGIATYALGAEFLAIPVALVVFFVVAFAFGSETEDERAATGVVRRQWERKYLCTRCGATRFLPTKQQINASRLEVANDAELDALIANGRIMKAIALFAKRSGVTYEEARLSVRKRARQLGR
jgi:ribosomal protein L37E